MNLNKNFFDENNSLEIDDEDNILENNDKLYNCIFSFLIN